MKELAIRGSDKFTLVDDEDFERLSKLHIRQASYSVQVRYWDTSSKKTKSRALANEVMQDYTSQIYDHKDRNQFNNQKDNLRPCNYSQNLANAKLNGRKKFRGVSFHKNRKKWQAYITKDKEYIGLGLYDSEIEAAKAFNVKCLELNGEFASLNNDENGIPL